MRERNEARCARVLDRSAPLTVADLAWGEIGRVALVEPALASLIYMRDVEGFTDRDLVGFTAHRNTLRDPLIRRFLRIWRNEEAGHAAVLDRYLRAYGAARSIRIPERQLPPPAVASVFERMIALTGGAIGRVVTCAHMAWGAANELLTLNGYRRLAARSADPVLAELLRRVAAQEARHFTFYLLQAEWRLAESTAARTVLRRVLRSSSTPVGIGDGYKHPSDFAVLMRYLAGGEDGERAVRRMDRQFAALPGFADLCIYRNAMTVLASG